MSDSESDAEQQPAPEAVPAPAPALPPPLDDEFTLEHLWTYNGTDPSRGLLVSIKGTVFDVSTNPAVYALNRSYNLFAGRDASYAMGKSSLRWEDAHPDYSALNEVEMGVLDQWHAMFSKKYRVVGRVIDHPTLLAQKEKGKGKAPDPGASLEDERDAARDEKKAGETETREESTAE
ncbi:Cytochrome B5 [Mycena kentingensis (nom. inval.)]|nr:Cytochrome B5 [Mycena kentingensis (nom. inval.)]